MPRPTRISSSSPTSSSCPQIGGTDQKVTTLEGLLFPDTYNLMAGDGPTELIGAPTGGLQQEDGLPAVDQRPTALGMTPYQIVIVASMLEKEASTADGHGQCRRGHLQPAQEEDDAGS